VAIKTTPECITEAAKLLAYCEKNFPVGERSTVSRLSVTGETFTQIGIEWKDGCLSAGSAREKAQDRFDKYAAGKSGALYWRSTPEIAFDSLRKKYAYYMRLLISDKPRKD
jgi:hypothetical protein